MNAEHNDPLVRRYLDGFRSGLKDASPEEAEEVRRELESHIAEAVRGGENVPDVLERLGPSDRLAKAYRAEMILNQPGRNWFLRMIGVTGLVLTASIPTMVIVPLLLGLGFGFFIGGVVAVAIALFPFAHSPFYGLSEGIDRLLGGLTGVGLLAVAAGLLYLLYGYMRLIVGAFRKVLGA